VTNEDIRERIDAARKEKDRLQGELDNILKKPFFKREKDAGSLKQLDQLQA
jgi:hypothetical protein